MAATASTAEKILLWERVDAQDGSLPWLRAQGIEVKLGRMNDDPSIARYAEADLIADAAGCVGLLGSGGARITRNVIQSLPGLRVVSKVGVGVDNIDVAAASERRIAVCHTPDDNDSVAVAEHALALLMALRKQLNVWTTAFMRDGGWRSPQTFAGRLEGSTVGIVGFGRIGRALAQRLAGWGVQILVHDPLTGALPPGVRATSLDELLGACDAVTLHCPALPGNAPLLDAVALARMRPHAVLINTARASLVDRAALALALGQGALAGAAIDVFDPEPPVRSDPLLGLAQVICTPHVASWTREGYYRRRQQAAENLVRQLRGQPGASVANASALS